MNNLKTALLLLGLTLVLVWFGALVGGQTGALLAFGIAVAMNAGAYWWSDRAVLAMYRAQEVPANHPDARVRAYAQDVREMAQGAGLPQPRVTIIESDQPNAFATGRDPAHAAVAATTSMAGASAGMFGTSSSSRSAMRRNVAASSP